MQLSQLASLLKKELEPALFAAHIDNEVNEFEKCLSKIGASCSIFVTEDISMVFEYKDLEYLLSLHNDGLLNKYALGYIIDGMIMADKVDFEDEELVDKLVLHTFPEG